MLILGSHDLRKPSSDPIPARSDVIGPNVMPS
jgi:hypothetical protein